MPERAAQRRQVNDRLTCCWTHCDNPQGTGTWTEINGEALPICEDHWYGNLDNERRLLREENRTLRNLLGQAIRLMGQAPSAFTTDMAADDWLDDALDIEGRAREAGVLR